MCIASRALRGQGARLASAIAPISAITSA